MNLNHPPDNAPDSVGDQAQVHRIVRQVVASYDEMRKPETPPLVKWVVGTIAALGLAAMIGGGTWLLSTVSSMQITLARMDERQQLQAPAQEAHLTDLDRRVSALEDGGRKP